MAESWGRYFLLLPKWELYITLKTTVAIAVVALECAAGFCLKEKSADRKNGRKYRIYLKSFDFMIERGVASILIRRN